MFRKLLRHNIYNNLSTRENAPTDEIFILAVFLILATSLLLAATNPGKYKSSIHHHKNVISKYQYVI